MRPSIDALEQGLRVSLEADKKVLDLKRPVEFHWKDGTWQHLPFFSVQEVHPVGITSGGRGLVDIKLLGTYVILWLGVTVNSRALAFSCGFKHRLLGCQIPGFPAGDPGGFIGPS